jgi:hypothetical protein
MRFRDTDGSTIFDTEERLMALTDRASGSAGAYGPYTATQTTTTNTNVDVDTLHSLGSINAAADVVRGSFSVSTVSGDGTLYNLGWFNASGTYVHLFEPAGPIGGPITTYSQITSISCYTFRAISGTLYLHERVLMTATVPTAGSFSITASALTLSYNLFCGTFI